ncbi:MAG: GvpL/GvpF family gas vesicle protein [Anaerolineales bacterium]|nr:GvpL/GvpF family gas vesicle protein [Anaerolineales bacterium]
MYLYAITDRPDLPVPAEPGLEGTSLFSLAYRDIVAVVSPLATTKVPPTGDNVWRHEAIVEALMTDRAVLPVRFGTVLADEAAVQATLAAHYTDFVANLERVRGRVELGLRVLWEIADSEWQIADSSHQPSAISHQLSAISGRAYLMARLEEERQRRAWRQRAEALAEEIHAPLARLAGESTRQVLITPRLLLTAAYLVERDRVATFRQEVEALSATYPALRFLCTGPWPTYNFVSRFPIDDVRFSI